MKTAVNPGRERVGLVLTCEGMGDCLFAQAVIRQLKKSSDYDFDLFTYHPDLFRACPYVDRVFHAEDPHLKTYPHQIAPLFELDKMPQPWRTATKLSGMYHPHGQIFFGMRLPLLLQPRRAKAAFAKIHSWRPEHIVLSHGRCFEYHAEEVLGRIFGGQSP